MHRRLLWIGVAAAALFAAATAWAVPANRPVSQPEASRPESPDSYAMAMELVQNEEFEAARSIFEKLHAADADDPDVLNMLAYTQRKTGSLDEALGNYRKALQLRPDFPQAQEYLGEAYLQLALRQIEILRQGGSKKELGQLVDAIHAAAAELESSGSGKPSNW